MTPIAFKADSDEIFHLAKNEDWLHALKSGSYGMSTRDMTLAEVGFIHCSFENQLTKVAEFVFAGFHEELLLLQLSVKALKQAGLALRIEENGNGELFPHLYSALPCNLIIMTAPAIITLKGKLKIQRN